MIFHLLAISILSILSVFAQLSTSFLDETELYANCSKPFQCSNIQTIGYPFWGGERSGYCGHPDFKLTCENQNYPQMTIQSYTYHVLSIDSTTNSLSLVRSEFSDTFCPSKPSNATINTPYLKDSSSSENITLFYGCPVQNPSFPTQFDCLVGGLNTTGYYLTRYDFPKTSNIHLELCSTSVLVQVKNTSAKALSSTPPSINISTALKTGFELVWDVNKGDCEICARSGGVCGSNPSFEPLSFVCFCRDKAYNVSCGDNGNENGKSSSSTLGRNIGIGVSSVVLLTIVIGCLYKAVEKVIYNKRKEKCFKSNGGLLLQQQLSAQNSNIMKINIFKSYELEKATNNYNVDRVLGQGGQGTVYKGILSDGRVAAIKKSKNVDTKDLGQFLNEVAILSQINHRNIVRLLGCCLETKVPILVYEFISNGTLYQQLQNPKEKFMLNWERRLQIAVETASTLSYLHNAVPKPIYHRDIKSTNILLDDKFKAKVADFGISRSVEIDVSHLTTVVRGTFGYLDPEYYHSSWFTEKSDVYSFGVVLVELLTGQKPIFTNTAGEVKGLAPYFMELMEENHFLKIIDPRLSLKDNTEEMVEVAHVAKACLDSIGKRRPTIKEVMVKLEGIRMSRKQTTRQENGKMDVGEACSDSSSEMEVWEESSRRTASSHVLEINSLPYNK